MSECVRVRGLSWVVVLFFAAGCSASNESRPTKESATTADQQGVDQGTKADSESVEDSQSAEDVTDQNGDPQTCDEQDFEIEIIKPRLMLLVDASSSMWGIGGSNYNGRIALDALTAMVSAWGQRIDFGTDMFPNKGDCDVTDPVIRDIIPNSDGSAAVTALPRGGRGSSTPLYCAIANFLDPDYAPIFSDPDVTNYLVVISDGADLCGHKCCGNPLDAGCRVSDEKMGELVDQIYEETGIRTFSIGFSGDISEGQLNAIAKNGGTGVQTFFNAQDTDTLNTALEFIAEQTISCSYKVDDPEEGADRDLVNFYFDGELVKYDDQCTAAKGWNWVDREEGKIEFCGAACDKLRLKKVEDVKATFGCDTVPVV